MFNVELISERKARESLENRRKRERERRERIFTDKVRTIGVDKETLDMQVKEKKKQEEEAKKEGNAYAAAVLQHNKEACILQHRQEKERREVEKFLVTHRHLHQQPWNRQEFDLNDPERLRKTKQHDAQMILPGLVGEDLDSKSRQLRQKQQLRNWLIQQQEEQEGKLQQQQMEQQQFDQSRLEIDDEAVKLHNAELERRKAAAIATNNYNLTKIEEKKHLEHHEKYVSHQCTMDTVDVSGLSPSSDIRPPPERLQQVEFQKKQAEEKKRNELKKKQEEERYDRIRLDSAHTALLLERQQARLNKQQRRDLDNINAQLAQIHRQKPDIKRGSIEDSFFSKFNTCSR